MFGSKIVTESEQRGDAWHYRMTMFTGNDPHIVNLAASLLERGHHLEKADGPIPGLWHIDGGPELTTNQMLGVARGLLA
jgi:hypothetical protein